MEKNAKGSPWLKQRCKGKTKLEDLSPTDFATHKSGVIKTIWYVCEHRPVYQWNRVESLEVDNIYVVNLFSTKVQRQLAW